LASFLKDYEGKVKFMYLDKKGIVTVGIGHRIDPLSQALNLQFSYKGSPGSIASAGDISSEWNLVKSRQDLKFKGGAAFAVITGLELNENGIQQMVSQHANAIEKYIKTNASARRFYANFDNWPADAQLGFMGVAWGGIPIPQFGWHLFPEACKREDWNTAAKECKISSPLAAGRNESHKRMFENAAQVKANDGDISILHWPAVVLSRVDIASKKEP
jgi:hypothetical protein